MTSADPARVPGIPNAGIYKEQAEAFLNYARRHPQKDVLSLFNEWVFSKDFSAADKFGIWLIVRGLKPAAPVAIPENSDAFVRVDTALKILLEADIKRLEKLIGKREKAVCKMSLERQQDAHI